MYWASQYYGTSPQVPSSGVNAPTQQMGIDTGKTGYPALVDPHNPLFWFGALLLVTVGAAGLSGSARFGPARVSGSVGKG